MGAPKPRSVMSSPRRSLESDFTAIPRGRHERLGSQHRVIASERTSASRDREDQGWKESGSGGRSWNSSRICSLSLLPRAKTMATAYGPSDQAATKASLKSWWERFKTNPNRTAKDDDKECEYMLAGWACARQP